MHATGGHLILLDMITMNSVELILFMQFVKKNKLCLREVAINFIGQVMTIRC